MTMVDLYSGAGTSVMEAELDQWGLRGLAAPAAAQWAKDPDPNRFMQWLRSTPEYKARFPYMEQLAKEGRAISEREALTYERATRQLFRNAGLPANAFDQQEYINKMILADVSYAELEQRVQTGLVKALNAPAEVRAYFAERLGDASEGALAAFYLDPDQSITQIKKLETQAQLVGRGRRFGLDINADLGIEYALGFSPEEIQARLAQAAQFAPLGRGVIGGSGVNDDSLVSAAFTGDTQRIDRELEQRAAAFSDGGGTYSAGATTGFGAAR